MVCILWGIFGWSICGVDWFIVLIVSDENVEHDTTIGPRDRLAELVGDFQVDVRDGLGVFQVLHDDRVVSKVAQVVGGIRSDGHDDTLFGELVGAVEASDTRVLLLFAHDVTETTTADFERKGQVRRGRGIDQVGDPHALDFDAHGGSDRIGELVLELDFTASIGPQIHRHLHFRPAHSLQVVRHRHPLDGRQSLIQHFHRHLWC